MRIQKYIAKCGITSRRKAEELILEGRVKMNGQLVRELGTKLDINKDVISIDNKEISLEEEKIYIIINKPLGYVSTVKDEHNRKTVLDLIKTIDERVYPVGRLDINTTGLLILTNDGQLTFNLTHPSNEVKKTYLADVYGKPKEEDLDLLRKGIEIEDYITAPASLEFISSNKELSKIKISIHEGRNRQVRKMFAEIGYPVKHLKRIKIGDLSLDELKLGAWRYLAKEEVSYLYSLGDKYE